MPGNKDLSNFDPKTYKDLNEFDSKFNSKRDKLLLNVKQPEQRRIKAELKAKIKKSQSLSITMRLLGSLVIFIFFSSLIKALKLDLKINLLT